MNEIDQKKYIKYLEQRIEKLSQYSSVDDRDLSNLVDAQNEVIVNNSYNFKWVISERSNLIQQIEQLQKNFTEERSDLIRQIEQLQKKIVASDQFIQYLMSSFWWRITYPLRLTSRHLKKLTPPKAINSARISIIKEPVKVIIYVDSPHRNIKNQLNNLRQQKGLVNIKPVLIDLVDSHNVAKVAKTNHAEYFNTAATQNDPMIINKILSHQTGYMVYINQETIIEDEYWLYKLIHPLTEGHTILSALYDKSTSKVKKIKKMTFYNELKIRIFNIDHYDCILIPTNRDIIQYIPPFITDQASIVAKPCVH